MAVLAQGLAGRATVAGVPTMGLSFDHLRAIARGHARKESNDDLAAWLLYLNRSEGKCNL